MFCRNKKTRNYQAPFAEVTQMELERSFCKSVILNVALDLDELENMNAAEDPENPSGEYFEDIIS